MKNKKNSLIWQYDFPPVYRHTSISFLKRRRGFYDAKKGSMDKALTVVSKCVKSKTIVEIKQKYPDAILIPVISNNKLPEALAMALNLPIHTNVHIYNSHVRKTLSAIERLLHKPCFSGKIIKGEDYIIVDDIITQGGTISALRKHIVTNGGTVVAVAVLASSIDSQIIAPKRDDIINLISKYSLSSITYLLKKYNIANDIHELTRAQIKYLLRFKDLNGLINKLEKTYIPVMKIAE